MTQEVTKEELIEALEGMCLQYLSVHPDREEMTHSFMSAGEQALATLERLGRVVTKDNGVSYTWTLDHEYNTTLEGVRAKLKKLIFEVLPQRAKAQGWVVTEDHCIARCVYDNAVQNKWDRVVEPPFYKNAPFDTLWAAYVLANQLVDKNNSNIDILNSRSLAWRRESPPPEG